MNESISASRIAALVGDFPRSPAYLGLADALREVIGDGRIGYGTRLPSERELTAELGVSRTTITRAYASLRESSYAEARQGSGTYTRLPGGRARPHDRALMPGSGHEGQIDLVCAAATAPPGIAAAYAEATTDLTAYLGSKGYYPAGVPALQAALAATYDARGLPTRPEQILVTPGALAAGAIVGRALAGPRDRVMVESPTYPNATEALTTGGGRLAAIPLDPEGWDLDAVAAFLARRRPRLAYLMPDFHNPTGLVMPRAQRRAYAALLRRHDCVPVVDEAHHALRLDSQEPLPPFATETDSAVTIGSASKSIWGGLRIGWIRAPLGLVERLTRARVSLDLGAPVLEQLVLARLLRGDIDAVLGSNRDRLRVQRDALAAALRAELPDWEFRLPGGGMSLWCRLPVAGSTALVDAAERHGVLLAPGPAFAPEGGLDRYLRLPYTASVPDLQEAVRRIATAWAELGRSGPGSVTAAVPGERRTGVLVA